MGVTGGGLQKKRSWGAAGNAQASQKGMASATAKRKVKGVVVLAGPLLRPPGEFAIRAAPAIGGQSADRGDLRHPAFRALDGHGERVETGAGDQFAFHEELERDVVVVPVAFIVPERKIPPVDGEDETLEGGARVGVMKVAGAKAGIQGGPLYSSPFTKRRLPS